MAKALRLVGRALILAAGVAAGGAPPAIAGRAIVVEPNAAPAAAQAATAMRDRLLALFKASRARAARIEQIPPSPVRLGTKDIRFRIVCPEDGFLVLLSVSDAGEVVQLFPNAISDRRMKGGAIRAGRPVTLPDASYGMRIDATEPTSGTVLALVTRDALALSKRFATRAIAVVPQDEMSDAVLPQLAAALAADDAGGRFVATLPYAIIP